MTELALGDLIFTRDSCYQVVEADEALKPGSLCFWTDKWVRTHERRGERWTSTDWHQTVRGVTLPMGRVHVYGPTEVNLKP